MRIYSYSTPNYVIHHFHTKNYPKDIKLGDELEGFKYAITKGSSSKWEAFFHNDSHTKGVSYTHSRWGKYQVQINAIQLEITPHMEVLHKELACAKNGLKKDPNLSTFEGLVHLVVEKTI